MLLFALSAGYTSTLSACLTISKVSGEQKSQIGMFINIMLVSGILIGSTLQPLMQFAIPATL